MMRPLPKNLRPDLYQYRALRRIHLRQLPFYKRNGKGSFEYRQHLTQMLLNRRRHLIGDRRAESWDIPIHYNHLRKGL